MNRVDLSQYDNSWFSIGAGRIKAIIWYYVNACFLNCAWNPSSGIKVRLLRMFGAQIGKGVVIKPSVNIKYPWNLSIGDYTWIGENVWIDNLVQVTIGSNACISQGAMLLCGNHNYKKATFDLIVKPITIEDGAWIGAQSTVCPGVTAHTHSVLSVGSVALKDLDAFSIYRGNPAEFIKKRVIE
ncbi:MAG: putative colanic acid biosynthesis acetyltransferase [Bacteroidales bacterium]|nr:putative colanic acid biosynthesis acetyltransferase [Bacteroidales bacterium]